MNIVLALAPGLTPTIPVWALAHLCAFLKSHGHDTHVIDFNIGHGIPMIHEGADWWAPAFAEKFFSEKIGNKEKNT